MANRPVDIAVIADAQDAVQALEKVGAAADQMGGHLTSASGSFDKVTERLENLGSISSQVSGGFGDIGGALTALTEKSYDAQDASLALESAQKNAQDALLANGSASLEYRTALLEVQKAQDAVAGPSGLGAIGAKMEAAAPIVMGLTGAFDLLNIGVAISKSAMVANAAATVSATAAQVGLNIAMYANPIGLIVAAVVILIGVIYLLVKNWDTVSQFFIKTWDVIKSAGAGVWDFVTSKIREFIGYITGLPGEFLQAGKNLIQGLANGIDSGIQFVKDKIAALAGLVPDVFKRILGIASPSRVLKALGINTMQGYNEGLQSQSSLVQRTISKLTAGVTSSFDINASASTNLTSTPSNFSAASSRGTVVNNNVTVQAGIGVIDTADSIQRQLEYTLSERARLNGGLVLG